ncbi:MAG: flavin reductase family protein [Cyclobacteriaceae bacterium]|nr:flavin reductase family protein [Cyclobacteriaceae bacterium]
MSIKTINPEEVSVAKFHGYMLGAVAPRPIAFASTVDRDGNVNLSPFSFFNCFSANPPILIFSPARRIKDNTTKHTLENVLVHDEVVINIVNHAIVEQMSLSSMEYDKGVNEFEKSGLTQISSQIVRPPRVGESPVSFECKVIEVKSLGTEGGAGNLVICEVLLMHIKEEVLDDDVRIDPFKLDSVTRMGGNWYCRAQGNAIFEIPKPTAIKGIGVDQIPEHIRNSNVLTGNNLGRLGNIERFPDESSINEYSHREDVKEAKRKGEIHLLAKTLLEKGEVENAWKVLLLKI